MKKKLTVLFLSVALITTVAMFVSTEGSNKGAVDKEMSQKLDQAAEQEVNKAESKPGTEFDAIDVEWDDAQVRRTIHHMSHQKIEANQKWGAIEITQERIETLSQIIDDREDRLKSYDTYREILDRWIVGDFSQADKDHNKIWKLQGGTVGEATGIASEKEEQAFIDRHFNKE
ncbi:hypothetical protein BpsM61_00069 [Bacillus phage vB_BpsM-61]|nr:hypothetical protein BpsM61_00069 [Bacillus phage vB_BpsM-61]